MKRVGQTVVLRFQSGDRTGNLLVMGMSLTIFVREFEYLRTQYFQKSSSFSQCTSP